jgi:hypothetical protein
MSGVTRLLNSLLQGDPHAAGRRAFEGLEKTRGEDE